MPTSPLRRAGAVVAGLIAACAALPPAAPAAYPPRPAGPKLDVPKSKLNHALTCPEGFRHRNRPVVLLVHGTATTATETWPAGFGKSLTAKGFDWCMVQLPDRELGDIQVSNEYVVAATRRLARETHRRVDLVGHSQGGLQSRWAVRWYPDLRRIVEDLVTFSGSNHGVASASGACAAGRCAPAVWQQRQDSKLEAALNRRRMPAGPSYTAIYSLTDELVEPNTSGTFTGASNVLVQSICPGRYVGHVQMVFDAVGIAVALDALEHRGAAKASRIPASVCAQTYGPGIDAGEATVAISTLYANAAAALAAYPTTDHEPPLRAYARRG